MQTGLELKNITKSWGDTTALNNVNLKISEGSFTALLGPSGCGKSTTLRIIAGLEKPTTGQVFINGQDVTDQGPANRDLAMVFQNYALFPHLTVSENIEFGIKLRKVPKAEREKRLKNVSELLSISHLMDRKPNQLSGGQQQRIALARAIVSERPICLMDEPLSNLDAKLRQEMRVELRALQKKLGLTMIYVTHDQTEAITMADQIVLMNNGSVEQIGSAREMYEQPTTTFSAKFIGNPPMNIIATNDVISHSAKNLKPSINSLSSSNSLGIRPEDITLTGPEDGVISVIDNIEYLGSDSFAKCSIGTSSALVRLPGSSKLAAGECINLGFDLNKLISFDDRGNSFR
ncbi:ABC transporter ATP-binding protein [Thaumasiovibrio sp. DFM-14]|uniref:ABC transporter ATP-binding protein n=1 Tax=Thaumasiovibrio sp. DFM-14 TaxID=3384792 RepID=UPI0039A19DD1